MYVFMHLSKQPITWKQYNTNVSSSWRYRSGLGDLWVCFQKPFTRTEHPVIDKRNLLTLCKRDEQKSISKCTASQNGLRRQTVGHRLRQLVKTKVKEN